MDQSFGDIFLIKISSSWMTLTFVKLTSNKLYRVCVSDMGPALSSKNLKEVFRVDGG